MIGSLFTTIQERNLDEQRRWNDLVTAIERLPTLSIVFSMAVMVENAVIRDKVLALIEHYREPL